MCNINGFRFAMVEYGKFRMFIHGFRSFTKDLHGPKLSSQDVLRGQKFVWGMCKGNPETPLNRWPVFWVPWFPSSP